MPEPTSPRPNFLRLVTPSTTSTEVTASTFVRPAWQHTLFANENASLTVFINFEQVTENEFTTALAGARPKSLFDLRRVPRFDLGTLTRRAVFGLFGDFGIQYADLSGRKAKPNAREMGEAILESRGGISIEGPIAFLVDSDQATESYISSLLGSLSNSTTPWDVLQVPGNHDKSPDKQRTTIFISHANPEDNVFASWLTQRLSLMGYEVWSDLSKLDGGELFWDDIERTIRDEAAKVIVVLSRSAQAKSGVLDEIDLAIRVERAEKFHRFVIPIRIDDLPFHQVRANLGRKNIVDFGKNWAVGLHALSAALENDRVPRSNTMGSAAINKWIGIQLGEHNRLVSKPEQLISNWLPISSLPPRIKLHDVSLPSSAIQGAADELRLPCFRYHRLIGTFASASAISRRLPPGITVKEKYSIDFREFMNGRSADLPGMSPSDARRIMSSMLRQAWDITMEDRGLIPFAISSGANAWYMPAHFLEANKISFLDRNGQRRRRSLVGWSEKRKVFWHQAIEARPVIGFRPHFALRQHVIFTADGKTPIASKERMHLLRRRFCKSWWNDRWRDLLEGFVSWLSANEGHKLNSGDQEYITLGSALMIIQSPISVLSIDEGTDQSREDELDPEDTEDFEESWPDEIGIDGL